MSCLQGEEAAEQEAWEGGGRYGRDHLLLAGAEAALGAGLTVPGEGFHRQMGRVPLPGAAWLERDRDGCAAKPGLGAGLPGTHGPPQAGRLPKEAVP